MNILFRVWCRLYQFAFKLVMYVLPWRKAKMLTSPNSILLLPEFIKAEGFNKVLVVTDQGIVKVGLLTNLEKQLKKEQMEYVIYDKTVPNPTIENIMEAYELYVANNCDSIIAMGGGSPMDCAKGVAAKVTKPKKPIIKMAGVLKICKKTPPVFAVPTTAGSGSETTLAAVITDSEHNRKITINDPMLIPAYVVLDPMLTVGLPKHITASTGLDALTHAVEAYIGNTRTKRTKHLAEIACYNVFNYLKRAYDDGHDIEAREKMLLASHYAGSAFTRSYVGYVHSIAHTLGGMYHVAHGYANAVILPHILRWYGGAAYKKLAALAKVVGIQGESDKDLAEKFIKQIEDMKKYFDIPKIIGDTIKDEDIPLMVKYSYKEANPLYPVPKLMSKKEMSKIYYMLKGIS